MSLATFLAANWKAHGLKKKGLTALRLAYVAAIFSYKDITAYFSALY